MNVPKTTIAEFIHPHTSSRIALVGNRHYGSRKYMTEIGTRLSEYEDEDSKVHYEGLRMPSPDELNAFNKGQLRTFLALRSLLDISERVHSNGQLVSIKEIMKPSSDNWEHHDTTTHELMKRANLRQKMALGAIGAIIKFTEAYNTDEEIAAIMNSDHSEDEKQKTTSWISTQVMNTINPLILDYRNNVALKAVDASLTEEPTQHLTLLWGDGHVPGLSTGLSQRGYKHLSSELLDPNM